MHDDENAADSSPCVAVLQARMGSSRIPGKVLTDLHGEPMLWRIVERVRFSASVSRIVVAATTDSRDDVLERFCRERGIACFRGDTDDIVGRLHGASAGHRPRVVVRVWCDCPYVDPVLIDAAVEHLGTGGLDFVNMHPSGASFPGGFDLEVYRFPVLEAMDRECVDAFSREFPAEYVKRNASLAWGGLPCHADFPDVVLNVDYPQDLALARRVFAALHDPARPFGYRDVLAYVARDAEIHGHRDDLPRNIEFKARRQANE